MNEDEEVGSGYIFNVVVGVFATVITLLIGYMLTELSHLSGVVAERGERITRIESRNDYQEVEIKRLEEQAARGEAERREIFEYLTGRKKAP